MLQLCKVTSALFISNARSACSDELLQQEAVTLCINVTKQQPFPAAGGVAKLQVAVYDDPGEDLYSHFDRCADAIQKEAKRGGRSVVYCKNGRSRSATVCVAYLMKHRGMTLTEALQRVKTARHVVDPNPGFMAQLQRYEEELKRRRRAAS
ncbi:dual specificity phosphatase 28 [Fundulus heteroclitus]|uniref:dual specificity phosphatase 28 n=1 Tax=Fundulus heteroclitus TaxID=8078 RepID=UPI00165C1852|nr:dual specificity phosphatase 28 [Fundulus heteroclitus]XP_021169445.2 dual specificity phosphatase 28 [Fundulus heteroclitus]XP_035989428.1 dual specificity phosphatase 28 [Fundulus heteroclitus]